MLWMFNQITEDVGVERRCDNVIISGGIRNFLDGYYLVENSVVPAIYGQAAAFLKNARGEYEQLKAFVKQQTEGYQLARQFLSIRKSLQEEKL
jgi:isopentenyl-diphosphate delta-isomerase